MEVFLKANEATDTKSLEIQSTILKTFWSKTGYEAAKKLSRPERVYAYYLYRAMLPGYHLGFFQSCRYDVLTHLMIVIENAEMDDAKRQAYKDWWVYLYANYGVHFRRESVKNKYTPSKLRLPITHKETEEFYNQVGLPINPLEMYYLFDLTYKPTSTVPKDINASGNAYYGEGITNEIYAELPENLKNRLNAYHKLENGEYRNRYYCSQGPCAKWIKKSIPWLQKAKQHAFDHPNYFDKHAVNSLDYLVRYLQSGDENLFREHSKEWLQTNNKVDYCFGWIEEYRDPMNHIGEFQANIEIKSGDMGELLKLLPVMEAKFPFPKEQKREDMSKLPNAASVEKIFGVGGMGPIFSTLAHCLPNYDDIRQEFGSKQVMFNPPPASDPGTYKTVFMSEGQREIYDKYSPNNLEALLDPISSLTTTLHETVGHGSGRNVDGVTNDIKRDAAGKWANALEEMRAEILALYCATTFYEEIGETGALGDWHLKLSREDALRLFIQDIAGAGWKRWCGLPNGTTEITQAHALADTGIMYYLIDHCPDHISLVHEAIMVEEGRELEVIRLHVGDPDKILPYIESMAKVVQRLSSTADKEGIENFMKTYAASTRNSEYGKIVTGMRDYVTKGIKGKVQVQIEWAQVVDEHDNLVDAVPMIPKDAYGHFVNLWKMNSLTIKKKELKEVNPALKPPAVKFSSAGN